MPSRKRFAILLYTAAACFLLTLGRCEATQEAQKPVPEPAAKSSEKADKSEKPAQPAQIELLETKVRFETNGDSRKEVHALVKINSELGVRQFAQLNFDFNRSFESVEIPMVHITHSSGGTADILPSAVTDHPNPAVVNAPAYQDVRVKSVRILGLQPGDTLEYRVIRTVTHHPLAPDFWLDHSFDRTGVVSHEIFELNLPASRFEEDEAAKTALQQEEPVRTLPFNRSWDKEFPLISPRIGTVYVSPNTPANLEERVTEGDSLRLHYRWSISPGELITHRIAATPSETADSDIVVSSFFGWEAVAFSLSRLCYARTWPPVDPPSIEEKRKQLLISPKNESRPEEILYDFVSQQIRTVELPLSSTGFSARVPSDTLTSGYGTPADKVALFVALSGWGKSACAFVPETASWKMTQLYRPSLFVQPLIYIHSDSSKLFLDPSSQVAPFGLIRSDLRGRDALIPRDSRELYGHIVESPRDYYSWENIARNPPFPTIQQVGVNASLNHDGQLSAKVHYSMRGDNELVLRLAFHHTPKERWKEVAQLLSITDGFRGQVSSVNASDPYATKDPFTVEYELDQPKFVDWSKKPVRIPALLPQLGLPDPPAKPTPGSATAPIELGTPLEVQTKMTLHLPPGTTASAPAGVSVERDYATYASQYAVNGSTVTATRHIKFVLREVPATRAADYNAFLRAVQSDEAQDFTLEPPNNPASKTNEPKANSAAPSNATPQKPVTPKP